MTKFLNIETLKIHWKLKIGNCKLGFTLIEIIVVIAISIVLILVGSAVFIGNSKFYQNQKGEIAAVNATRAAGDRLSEFARAATDMLASRQFGAATYTTSATMVVLRVPSIDASGNLIAGAYDYAAFGRDPNNASRLLLVVDGAAGSVRGDRTLEVTDKLSAISLTYDNADPTAAKQVTYTITVTDTGRYAATEQVTGRATLRN